MEEKENEEEQEFIDTTANGIVDTTQIQLVDFVSDQILTPTPEKADDEIEVQELQTSMKDTITKLLNDK